MGNKNVIWIFVSKFRERWQPCDIINVAVMNQFQFNTDQTSWYDTLIYRHAFYQEIIYILNMYMCHATALNPTTIFPRNFKTVRNRLRGTEKMRLVCPINYYVIALPIFQWNNDQNLRTSSWLHLPHKCRAQVTSCFREIGHLSFWPVLSQWEIFDIMLNATNCLNHFKCKCIWYLCLMSILPISAVM